MQLDQETVSLIRRMVLCQTPEMPAIKSIVMAGVENQATRRLRFITELQKRGMERLDDDTAQLLNLTIEAWGLSDAAKKNIKSQSDVTLAVAPAVRLMVFGQSDFEPENWDARWKAAGDAVGWKGAVRNPGHGPDDWSMTALKLSPIWRSLGSGAGGFSDTYGWPHPPFAVGSGLAWLEVDREECIELGLI